MKIMEKASWIKCEKTTQQNTTEQNLRINCVIARLFYVMWLSVFRGILLLYKFMCNYRVRTRPH